MPKLDRLKEEIGWLKVVLAALVAVDASLIGWLTQNYSTGGELAVIAAISATMVTAGIALTTIIVYSRLAKLEDI